MHKYIYTENLYVYIYICIRLHEDNAGVYGAYIFIYMYTNMPAYRNYLRAYREIVLRFQVSSSGSGYQLGPLETLYGRA